MLALAAAPGSGCSPGGDACGREDHRRYGEQHHCPPVAVSEQDDAEGQVPGGGGDAHTHDGMCRRGRQGDCIGHADAPSATANASASTRAPSTSPQAASGYAPRPMFHGTCLYAWLIGPGRGPVHHLAQRHHRRAPSAARCGPLRARVRDLRWHRRDGAVRG